MNYSRTLTVTQVSTYIKSLLEGDKHLTRVMVRGEISNFKYHTASGHFYFTLKDDRSLLRAVMFKAHASSVRFTPQDGMAVVAGGAISVYERDGQYQLYCTDLLPEGIGALALAFEQRKAEMAKLGLFDAERKKTIPPFPERIAVITSKTGAAIEDIRNVVARRFPAVELLLCPVPVQGEDAPTEISEAISRVNVLHAADVILLARGGGSYEDLFCFNDERIAYAIYNSVIPVISAVGHETDFTIADFVADLRAPTPSAGAELAVPDRYAVLSTLRALRDQMRKAAESKIALSRFFVSRAEEALKANSPQGLLLDRHARLALLQNRLGAAAFHKAFSYRQRLTGYIELLDSLSPLRVLQRGYAVVLKGSHVIKSTEDVFVGDRLTIRVQNGFVEADVVQASTEPATIKRKG